MAYGVHWHVLHPGVFDCFVPCRPVSDHSLPLTVIDKRYPCGHVLFVPSMGKLKIGQGREHGFYPARLPLPDPDNSAPPVKRRPHKAEKFFVSWAQRQRVGRHDGPLQPLGGEFEYPFYVSKRHIDFGLFNRQAFEVAPGITGDKLLVCSPCEDCADIGLVLIDCVVARFPGPELFPHFLKVTPGQAVRIFVTQELGTAIDMLLALFPAGKDSENGIFRFVVVVWVCSLEVLDGPASDLWQLSGCVAGAGAEDARRGQG